MFALTPEDALEEIRDHVVQVDRDGKRTLKVKCDSSTVANGLIYPYGTLYGYTNVTDAGFHFLNTDKYAYPCFRTAEMRENALAVTNALMNGEEVTYVSPGTVTVGPSGVSYNNDPVVTVIEEDEVKDETIDWTTYIILGAAAAVILLLLWDKK